MNRIDKILLGYLVGSFPLVLFLLIGEVSVGQEVLKHFSGPLWDGLGWLFIFWILTGLTLVFRMLFLSLFTVTVGKYPEGARGPDKNGYIPIAF